MGLFNKIFSREKKETLDKGLEKTKQGVFEKIKHAVAGKSTVDDDVLDNLEEVFVTSDVGVDTTVKIIERLQERVARDKYVGTEELNELLCDEISQMLADNNNAELEDFTVPEDSKPYVIMVVGVNGVGKTTTIGKLAYQFKQAGNKVVLGAADTYRAAADEQLEIWGNRVGVPVIKHKMGTDPAAVAYDAVQSAKAQNADVVIIDTAGRLHNNISLMNQLTKIKNTMKIYRFLMFLQAEMEFCVMVCNFIIRQRINCSILNGARYGQLSWRLFLAGQTVARDMIFRSYTPVPGVNPDEITAGTEPALICDFSDLERSVVEQMTGLFQTAGRQIGGKADAKFAVKTA